MLKIGVLSEGCVQAGSVEVCRDDNDEFDFTSTRVQRHDGEIADNHDLDIWEAADEAAMVRTCVEALRRQDLRAGGAGDAFRWRCARNILRFLDRTDLADLDYEAAALKLKGGAD